MKAVAYTHSLPIEHPSALIDCKVPEPKPGAHDLLVEVQAIAVNPVDCKIRKNVAPPDGQPKILGWDAAGIVREVGESVQGFQPGDAVFYAGDLSRSGSNAQLQVVDARIVGRKPQRLSFSEAAALPLTSLTAWELLFDRLQLDINAPKATLFVLGAAGGVGSILVQLARKLTQARVVASYGRVESRAWLQGLASLELVDHQADLQAQLQSLKCGEITHVASLTHTDVHYAQLVELMAPQGRFGLIDDPQALDIKAFKRKSISLHWEFMYTRSLYGTADMARQGWILNEVARLVDEGILCSTVAAHFGAINAANLRRAHALLEAQQSRGKIVLEGFD